MNPKLSTISMLADILIPLGGYFVLRAAGLGEFWALTVPGIAVAVLALATTLGQRRLDKLGALVVLEVALSAILIFTTRDPRIVLLKPSFYTGLAGLYLLYTCLVGRPFFFEVSKPFATRGDPAREAANDRAWASCAGFRREHRMLTVIWGVLWLAESLIRAVIVLHSSVSHALLAGQLPGLAALIVGVIITRARVPALRRYVTANEARHSAAGPASRTALDQPTTPMHIGSVVVRQPGQQER